MSDVRTVDAKYVFLDIVSYSKRHVEAQCDIITSLNKIVKEVIDFFELKEKVKCIPTGDGMCIALLNISDPFDIHLQIALSILEKLREYNNLQDDVARKFEVRVGINGNTDNLVIDINGNENIAGAGINYSQRVMNFADGGNILIGEPIYNCLSQREKYVNSFREFRAKVKHGLEISVYQYINPQLSNISSDVPTAFEVKTKVEPKLNEEVAYFIALLVKNSESIKKVLRNESGRAYAVAIALYMLSLQCKEKRSVGEYREPAKYIPEKVAETIEDLQEYYYKNDFRTNIELCDHIESKLNEFSSCFFEGGFSVHFENSFQADKKGIEKLKEDFPEIAEEFEFE